MPSKTGGETVSQRPGVLYGPLRFIIRSAHKWGGDGAKPKESKIKRVLMEKHPDVVTKVFQGDADKAGAWIKDAWYRYHGISLPGKTGSGPTYWRTGRKGSKLHAGQEVGMADLVLEYVEVPADVMDEAELFMDSEKAPVEKDGLVWVEATRTGQFAVNPVRGAKGPLVIDEPMLDATIKNFEAGAWEHVTLPLADDDDDNVHKDLTRYNTGAVMALRKATDPKDGRTVLLAGCDITEPDVKQRVLNRSIRGRSVGIRLTGVRDLETGKRFEGPVLRHIAWTNKPFVSKLKPGAVNPEDYVYASRLEDETVEIEVMLAGEEVPVADQADLDALERMVEAEGLEDDGEDAELDEIARSLDEVLAARGEGPGDLLLSVALTAENRRKWAKQGVALSDGSYPIPNTEFLKKAVRAFGRAVRAGKAGKVKAHIVERAKALKATHLLPDNWGEATSQVNASILEMWLAAPEDETPAEEKTDGTVPASDHYRVATDVARKCGTCTYFDPSSKNKARGYDMGECTEFDAPVHSDHVCDAWKAASAKARSLLASRDGEDHKVIRLVG